MTDNLRDRIAKVLYRCDYDLRDWEKATDVGKQPYYDDADAVIAVVSDEYINSRGMFHEPDRCMEGDGCQEEVEDENL